MTGRTTHLGQKKDRPRGVQSKRPKLYIHLAKAAGALVCADCGVVQHGGRWTWGAPPLTGVKKGRCPACQRIRDHYPAGVIELHPAFLEKRVEVLRLMRNVEKAERTEHPLERLMDTEPANGHWIVTTTGIHLARQIAHGLARRFHQKARIRYAENESLIHVDWD
jgi:hypothetical protein